MPYLIIAYVFSSTKLEIRAEQVHMKARGLGREGKGRGWGEEMAQIMYEHVNK
jgi:hypothetical protein